MSKPGETTDSAQQLYQAPESIQINTHTQQDELTETTTVSLQAVQYQMQQIPNDTSIQPPADFSAAPQNAVKNATERSSWKDEVRNFFRPRQAEQQEVTEVQPEIQVQEQAQEQEQAQVQVQEQAQMQEQAQVQEQAQEQKKEAFARISLKQAYENETQERSLAYHQVLRANIAYDEQLKNSTRAYQKLMSALKDYTSLNVTETRYSKLSAKVSHIQKLLNSYPNGDVPSAKELIIFHRYKLYFDTNFNGALEEVPAGAIHDDYSNTEIATGLWHSSNHDASDLPLFAKEPTVDDIEQRLLGDCYLQAALISMVQQDPQAIKRCMRDNGNGTVTVRFFKKDAPEQPLIPKYVTVTKTVPKSLGMDTFSANNLWVQMIEKAYVASGLHKNTARPVDTQRTYSEIEGGQSHLFLTTLTGKEHTRRDLPQATIDNVSDFLPSANFQNQLTQDENIDVKAKILSFHGILDYYIRDLCFKQTPSEYIADSKHVSIEDIECILEHTFSENTWIPKDCKTMFDSLQVTKEFLSDYKRRLINLLENYESDTGLQLEHAGIMEQNGQGVYSKSMLTLYDDIQDALKKGSTLCCGTRKLSDNQSGLNGESEANGMVGRHAYTILGCEEHDGHKFIRMRNPWNTGVKEYVKITEPDGTVHFTSSKRKNLFSKDTGTFLLDLADFKNTVDTLYY